MKKCFSQAFPIFLSAWMVVSCSVTYVQKTKQVSIATEPPGALVTQWDRDDKGKRQIQLGRAPIDHKLDYKIQTTHFNHWWWALSVASAGLTAGGGVVWGLHEDYAGSVLTSVGLVGVLLGVLVGVAGEASDGIQLPIPQSIEFTGSLDGYRDSSSFLKLNDEDKQSLFISLGPERRARPSSETPQKTGVILAVFGIEDRSETFGPKTLNQFTEFLIARISQYNAYRVVPKGEIQKALRNTKRQSYQDCYDSHCQIELGRAVAAQKSLSTVIVKPGEKCILTATVFDLRSEVTETGSSVATECTPDDITKAITTLARQLSSASASH